jgi:hypothetical protein
MPFGIRHGQNIAPAANMMGADNSAYHDQEYLEGTRIRGLFGVVQNGLRRNASESLVQIYSFEGFQLGFRFSAKAFSPSRAFSPDCRGSLNRSIVS